MELRPYQEDACAAIRREIGNGQEPGKVRSTVLVLPTGTGKTRVFSDVVAGWRGRVLVLAHRTELITQARKSLEHITGEYTDVEQGDRSSYSARIVVGSMLSVAQKRRLYRLGRDAFSLIVIDEGHRTPKSYRKILDWFSSANVLAVTATPDGAGGKALELYDSVAYQMEILDAIEGGWLVPVEVLRKKSEEIDLSEVKKTGGDLVVGQLDRAMLKAAASVAEKTCEVVGPDAGQGVVFFPGVESGMLATEWFNRIRPGSAKFVCGQTDPDERKDTLHRYAQGDFQFLVNVMVLSEGWDHPPAKWCVMARGTLQRYLVAQMAGRVTRPLAGVVDGLETAEERRAAIAASAKPCCTILDFRGNFGKHSLVTPEDILGKDFTPAEIAEAKRAQSDKPVNVVDSLLSARRRLKELAAAHEARQRIELERVDAFRRDKKKAKPDTASPSNGATKRATEDQLKMIRRLGRKVIPNITKRQASKLLDKHLASRKATFGQLRALRHHVDVPDDLLFSQATRALNYVMGQREKGLPVAPGQVQQLLRRQG